MNLTGLSYLLAILIAGLGISGEWLPNPVSDWWRLLAAVWIALLLIEWRVARRSYLSISREVPATIHLGRAAELVYHLANRNTMPCILRSMDVYPAQIAEEPAIIDWSVPPGKNQTHSVRITATQLGEVHWSRLQLRIRGRFGLAWWSKRLDVSTQTTAIPDRLYSHELYKSATAHQGDLSRKVLGIGSELIGLREYLPGDPLHYIDWKATARSNKTMVRLFSDEQHLELIIAIDAGRTSTMQAGGLTRLGHYINVASRLAQKALLNGDQIGLVVFADSVLASMHRLKGHHGLQRLRTILGQINSVARESNPLPAIMRIKQLAGMRSLVVVLTDLDDGDAAAQLVKAMALLQPKHQPMLAAISDSEVRRLSDSDAVNWLDPYQNLAASEMLQNWKRTRVRLERMGIPVVLSDIRYLDKQVLDNYDRLKEQKRI